MPKITIYLFAFTMNHLFGNANKITMNQFEPKHRIRSQRTEPIHHVLRLDGFLTHAIFRKHALHHLTRIGTAWKLQTGKGKSTWHWHLQQFDNTLFAILPDMTIQTPNSSSFQHP